MFLNIIACCTSLTSIEALRQSLKNNDWVNVESALPYVPPSILAHHDTFMIVQLLHTTLRASGFDDDASEIRRKLLLATDRLVELYRDRVLPPDPGASMRLLSIYKENKEPEKAKALWHWLSTQDEEGYVSAAVYGSAIEALAYAGEPLAELETLYQQALIRFPGNFTSYHLSPEAVVPDRGQPASHAKIPILLLQGIFTARLLNGDWRNAYLAFDVALRLMPDMVPKRFFDLIIVQRPLAEAVQVFKLACFAKALSSPSNSRSLLHRGASAAIGSSVTERVRLAANAIEILEAEIATGRPLVSSQLSQAIKSLMAIPCSGELVSVAMRKFNRDVAECGSRLFKLCGPYLSGDRRSSFNTMLELAGKAKHKELMGEVCETISELNTWDEVTHRVLITAIGLSREIDGLEDAWELLVQRAGRDKRKIDQRDMLCLAKAVRRIDSPAATAFATKQLALHPVASDIPIIFQESCKHQADTTKEQWEPTEERIAMLGSKLRDALDGLEAQTQIPAPMRYNWRNSFPGGTTTLPDGSIESNYEIVYNELTVDPLQPSPPQNEAQISKHGVPLDSLRFIHWKTVNGLLLLAKEHEKRKEITVEDAIATGGPLKFSDDQLSVQLLEGLHFPQTLEEFRLRVLELRGRI